MLPDQSKHPSLFPSTWCILGVDDIDFFRLEKHAILFTIVLFMSPPAGKFLHVKTIHWSLYMFLLQMRGSIIFLVYWLTEWMNKWPMGKTKLRIHKSVSLDFEIFFTIYMGKNGRSRLSHLIAKLCPIIAKQYHCKGKSQSWKKHDDNTGDYKYRKTTNTLLEKYVVQLEKKTDAVS